VAKLRRPRRVAAGKELRRMLGVEEASRRFLLYFVMPLWMGAGLADWWRHRKTSIETTAGTHESVIHALQMSEGGVPALLGLFLEVNAGVLAATYATFAIHYGTAFWDVKYAESRREVTPNEQHIHGLLEVVPLMAASFLTVLHWDQARALVGVGGDNPRFRPQLKRRPLPASYVAGLGAAISAFVVVPYAEEIWRCWRVDRTLDQRPEAPVAPTPAARPGG
jgi:hypothetical protein